MKRQLGWIGVLSAFWVAVVLAPEIFGWPALGGLSSLIVRIFLGYCAIILVAQVFSALAALRSLLQDVAKRRVVPQRVLLRVERPTSGRED